jgi:rare lipoprotein A
MKLNQIIATLLLAFLTAVGYAQEVECQQVGVASFYADKFVGRKTASGERFSQKKMTCAHRTLPFGTKLRVTNTTNGKSIIVTVNDRGPYIKGRVLDLSLCAAQELDFVRAGKTEVMIETIINEEQETETLEVPNLVVSNSVHPIYNVDAPTAAVQDEGFTIQLGGYNNQVLASDMAARAKNELGRSIMMQMVTGESDTSYLVFVGLFYRREEAHDYLDKIETYYPDAQVAQLTAMN